MNWLQILYASPLFIAAIASFILALPAWKHRSAPGAKAFALLMLAAGVWSLTYALSLANISQEAKLFWIKVRYIGIVIVPSAWLVFSLQQSGMVSG